MICISEVYFYNDPVYQDTGEERSECPMCGSFEHDLVSAEVYDKKQLKNVEIWICDECSGELDE